MKISDLLRFAISVAIILGALAYAHIHFLQKFRFILAWLSQGIGIINQLVDWVFFPLKSLFQWLVKTKRSSRLEVS